MKHAMRCVALLVAMLFSLAVNAQEFHIVFLNKKEDKAVLPEEVVKKLMSAHMANIGRLAKEGKLWAAGPFDGGGGIFIFKTSSRADVTNWIMTDSAVAAGRWNVEIFPFQSRTGSVCVVGETYEMTNYFFVRYKTGKVDAASAESHQKHLGGKAALTIAEAGLGSGNGSILVLREDPGADWIQSDPAVKSGSFLPEMKKLYIAKGSFCEPK